MKTKLFLILLFSLSLTLFSHSFEKEKSRAINSGVVLFDQNNNEVNAHGACIVKEGDLYYLFGEYKSDTTNAFVGFASYSSPDLINWRFENMVLPMQKDGILGPDRVGERVKVMKCPSTGEFVMYMHCDDLKYTDPHVGYAICKTINGDYQFQGDLLHNGKYLRKWDLGTFQDNDGKGYLLTHEGFIYELTSDYKSVERVVVSNIAKGGESPSIFKSNGYYFWLFSNKTSWERNDNYYFTATSLEGPWVNKGNFAPEGTLTWNSQCTFVLPIVNKNDTLHMYMGDRWSFPKQGSAGTYVWQPITINGDEMSIPLYYESWYFDKSNQWFPLYSNLTPIKKSVQKQGNWDISDKTFKSKDRGASITFSFKGKQVSLRGFSNNMSGYAKVILRNSKNEEVINTIVDFYSKKEDSSQKFLSPKLKFDNYTLHVEVMGEYPFWTDKTKNYFGSTDNYVTIESVLFK